MPNPEREVKRTPLRRRPIGGTPLSGGVVVAGKRRNYRHLQARNVAARQTFVSLIAAGQSVPEAALGAGMPVDKAWKAWEDFMEGAAPANRRMCAAIGLGPMEIFKAIHDALSATKVIVVAQGMHAPSEMHTVVDHPTRLRAAETAIRVAGMMPREELVVSGNPEKPIALKHTINGVTPEDVVEAMRALARGTSDAIPAEFREVPA